MTIEQASTKLSRPRFDEFSQVSQVAVRAPDQAFASADRIADQWQILNYEASPDLATARVEFDGFCEILREAGADIVELPGDDGLTLDSLYVRDSLITSPRGLIRAAMGKPARSAEPHLNAEALCEAGHEIIGAIEAPGRVEGGDLAWLDRHTVVAGRGYRTNSEGLRQLGALLGADVEILGFDLPHYQGPGSVFHLMSVLSPVDRDLAVVYPPLAPVALLQGLAARAVRTVEVSHEEFKTMACNVLALGPRRCVMLDGNPQTRRALERAGAQVTELAGDMLCRPGEGGPTCLTRPLVRSG